MIWRGDGFLLVEFAVAEVQVEAVAGPGAAPPALSTLLELGAGLAATTSVGG